MQESVAEYGRPISRRGMGVPNGLVISTRCIQWRDLHRRRWRPPLACREPQRGRSPARPVRAMAIQNSWRETYRRSQCRKEGRSHLNEFRPRWVDGGRTTQIGSGIVGRNLPSRTRRFLGLGRGLALGTWTSVPENEMQDRPGRRKMLTITGPAVINISSEGERERGREEQGDTEGTAHTRR